MLAYCSIEAHLIVLSQHVSHTNGNSPTASTQVSPRCCSKICIGSYSIGSQVNHGLCLWSWYQYARANTQDVAAPVSCVDEVLKWYSILLNKAASKPACHPGNVRGCSIACCG